MGAANKWSDTAVLVIDMQKEFVDPAMGSLAFLAGGEAIPPAVTQAVELARERGIFVVWVVREHDPDGRDVELFRRRFYSGGKGPAMKASQGAAMADGLVFKEEDYKLVKTRFSSCFATNLDSLLKTSGIKNLVVVGVQTPNCVRQTVFDAVALDYEKITVIVDATAAANPEIHIANVRHEEHWGGDTNLGRLGSSGLIVLHASTNETSIGLDVWFFREKKNMVGFISI
ncbi:putative inactive nicotinamidase [Panicum miliaceum]|uniref:Inactive nicotinamidase n=1 Tax=Panicum miliaceum TaxID=4540 RepID=A0A3L6QGT0_PANMI|nr:putative inactive nicotinamidase [Panicum miliaceum]